MLEALVLSICLQGNKGCSEALRAYYATPSPITKTIKRHEKRLKRVPYLNYIGPVVGAAVGYEATIKLHRNHSLTISKDSVRVVYELGF